MTDPCPHPRFDAAEHTLCPDCDEHANDVERDRLRAAVAHAENVTCGAAFDCGRAMAMAGRLAEFVMDNHGSPRSERQKSCAGCDVVEEFAWFDAHLNLGATDAR